MGISQQAMVCGADRTQSRHLMGGPGVVWAELGPGADMSTRGAVFYRAVVFNDDISK
jgi:hypothetical protein